MTEITIAWMALALFVGFIAYLIPKLSRWLTLFIALTSAGYAWQAFLLDSPNRIELLDSFGVMLSVDRLSGWFILTNAIVTLAVLFYCWQTNKKAFFYMQLILLHASVNATFICADLISLYVALEVISIAAFLLITYPLTDKSIWVGLRYLFISNTVMLFYLVGAVQVYKANYSFGFGGMQNAPVEAIALIVLGLLAKGGIFFSGFWLPLTHSESESYVSAMLSGVVVKAGVFPLVRLALMNEEIAPIIQVFGVATALLGVTFAMLERDTKRTLAFSTISQLGFILAAPAAGGFYALTHGLAKSTLFLTAGVLPSRSFEELKTRGINPKLGIILTIAGLSIAGFPLVSGFGAKLLALKELLPWQAIALNIATVGTAITFAKFIFLPWNSKSSLKKVGARKKTQPNFWWGIVVLLGGLIIANGVDLQVYTASNLLKSLIKVAIGWSIYLLILKKRAIKLPRKMEQFDHLIGGMSLILILVFWMIKIQPNISNYF